MEEKLRNYFEDMVVYKDLKESNFFKSLNLPSFLRDWLLKMFEDEEGHFDVEEITNFIHSYIPSKTDWIGIKNRIVVEGERVKILTRISVDINIKTKKLHSHCLILLYPIRILSSSPLYGTNARMNLLRLKKRGESLNLVIVIQKIMAKSKEKSN